MKKTAISVALSALALGVTSNASASLATDAALSMGPQTGFCSYGLGTYPDNCTVAAIPDGNYFAMDNDGSGSWEDAERVGIDPGTDGGIILGKDQSATGLIDETWGFFGNPGNHLQAGTVSVATDDGNGNATLDMTGWTVFWNNVSINMGTGDPAVVTCGVDCSVGDSFTLDYNALVPDDGSTNFGNVAYQFHIEGTVGSGSAVIPVPAAVWLFGSGLLGLVGVARRKKQA